MTQNPTDKADFLAKLAELKADYIDMSLPEQVADIKEKFTKFKNVSDSEEHIDIAITVNASAHKLTGSSGTFGLGEISILSRKIHDLTECARVDHALVPEHVVDEISLLMDQLCSLANKIYETANDVKTKSANT